MHPELIELFRLGFTNRTLGYRLPKKAVKAGSVMRGRLAKLGILRASGHEHFNGSLVIPVVDGSGRVVEMYGRRITRTKGSARHLYLPGPHRGIFNSAALVASPEVILCESLIDALTFWCAGFPQVTSAYGVNGFTAEMEEAFLGHRIERVLIAYDRDEAGDAAAGKLAERLLAQGIGCWRVQFPRGMDANEYALEVKPAARSLDLVLLRAEWMGEGEPPDRGLVAAVRVPGVVPAAASSGEGAARKESAAAAGTGEASAEPAAASSPAAPAVEISADRPDPSPATRLPAPPAPELPVAVSEQEVVIAAGDRRYRVRGLGKNLSYDVLRVNLLASRGEVGFHVDTLDLYSARQRAAYIKQAAVELGVEPGVVKADLGRVLLKLEELQDEQIQRALAPAEPAGVKLTPAEEEEALALLRDPALLDRVLDDFERCGVVGEEVNKLTGYLAAVSRRQARPLAVLIQSSSAAGKSALMEAILAFVPEEERVSYSAMTGQSLYYMGETDLKHEVLAVVEEEGAERASYALKLLQSEGELTIASTGKARRPGSW